MITEMRIQWNKFITELKRKCRVSECFHADSTCSEKIIKAHSIQNNRILNKISKNGQLTQITSDSFFTNDATNIGRNIATTFTGFCGKHDNEIFKPIEESDFNSSEQEIFLFTYRTLAREYLSKKFAINLHKESAKRNPYGSDLLVLGATAGLNDLEKYKKIFNNAMDESNYSIIKSRVITIDSEYLIAVSSMFNLEYDLEGNKTNDLSKLDIRPKALFFNIFPQNGKTIVILSYLTEDANIYDKIVNELATLEKERLIEKLNLLICMYCENFVVNPDKWDFMDKKAKTKFIELWAETMNPKTAEMLSICPGFNLFF